MSVAIQTAIRGLSVRQPWAWLLASGFKLVENRSWNTTYRGPCLIQASSSKVAINDESIENLIYSAGDAVFNLLNRPQPKECPEIFQFGKAIGTVEIAGCVCTELTPEEYADPHAYFDAIGANPKGDRYTEDVAERAFELKCRQQGFGDWLKRAKESLAPHGLHPAYFATGEFCILIEPGSQKQFLQPFEMMGKLNLFKLDAELTAKVRTASKSIGDPVQRWLDIENARVGVLRDAAKATVAKKQPVKKLAKK